jgi:hypothetical protein
MKYSKMKSCRVVMALALLLVTAQAVTATPLPNPIYQSGPITSHIQSGLRIADVTVNAYVWNLADYKLVNPTFELTDGSFVYEYLVHNLSTSTVSLSMFQVAISGPQAINDISTMGTVGGIPADAVILDADTLPSANYFFNLKPALTPNMTSCKLVYTSDFGINTGGSATIGGGGGISSDIQMPTPVPEPVSALLLGIGGLALARKRKMN